MCDFTSLILVNISHALMCDLRRVDVGMLHDELQTIGDMLQQQITVTEHFVLFAECDHCVTAYSG